MIGRWVVGVQEVEGEDGAQGEVEVVDEAVAGGALEAEAEELGAGGVVFPWRGIGIAWRLGSFFGAAGAGDFAVVGAFEFGAVGEVVVGFGPFVPDVVWREGGAAVGAGMSRVMGELVDVGGWG